MCFESAFLIRSGAGVSSLGSKLPPRRLNTFLVSFHNETVTKVASHTASHCLEVAAGVLGISHVTEMKFLRVAPALHFLLKCWVFWFLAFTPLQPGECKQLRGPHVQVRWACREFKPFLCTQWPNCTSLFNVLSFSTMGRRDVVRCWVSDVFCWFVRCRDGLYLANVCDE